MDPLPLCCLCIGERPINWRRGEKNGDTVLWCPELFYPTMSGSLAIISACGGCCGCKCKHRMSFFHLRTQPGSCQGRRVGWGGVYPWNRWGVWGAEPLINSRVGRGLGRRAAALPPQEDPTIVFIHPYIQISICPYQYQFISIQSKIHNPEINDLLVKKRSTSLFGIFWSSDWYHIQIFRTHFSIRIYLA